MSFFDCFNLYKKFENPEPEPESEPESEPDSEHEFVIISTELGDIPIYKFYYSF